MLKVQTVELTQRLRKLLGLRGTDAVNVDSVASPTVMVHDATGAPFRTDGRRWFVGFEASAVAAQFNEAQLYCDPQSVCALDGVWIWNTSGVVLSTLVRVGASVTTLQQTFQGYSLEGAQDATISTNTANVPVYCDYRSAATSSLGKTLIRVQVPANSQVYVPLDTIAQDAFSSAANICVLANVTNTPLGVQFTGRIWPKVG